MSITLACRRRACTAFALIVLAFGGTAQAQVATFDVHGTVRANDGTPIGGAAVVLSSVEERRRARTDARGAFEIPSLPGGTYTLRAAAPRYQTITERAVTVGPGAATIEVVLSPATTNSLAVIGQVQASAGETVSTASAPTVSMSAQTAAASGATSVAPLLWNQLSTTPALPLGGGSNATVGFAVRGPDPRETLVDIDGHQQNNGNTGDVDVSLLDPAALQEVQVVYGIAPSSLAGPNSIGGGINIVTLQPTTTDHSLMRVFGGSYGTFGETLQSTGTADNLGYAISLHNVNSNGSINQTIVAPPAGVAPPADDEFAQSVGSGLSGQSMLTKLRYQLGGADGYGYVQLNFRDQSDVKDESALLTNYTPSGYGGGAGGDVSPNDGGQNAGGYQSFAGTSLLAHQADYGLDTQLPLGGEMLDGAPATMLQLSHLTTVNSQSITGPGADTMQYLYNQRDALNDDWLQLDHRFGSGTLSFKYDLETENLTTNYVQSQVIAGAPPVGAAQPPLQTLALSQTERYAVLRYSGDPTSHIHYSIAAYDSNFSTFGSSLDPRVGLVWTPTSNTAVRASAGTTFQTPQLSELFAPPASERVPVGGIVYVGNPNLRPDRATDFDLGAEQIFGKHRPLHLAMDLYQTNLRSPSSQTNPAPIPHCQSNRNPVPCPISMPVNAGDGVYRGIDVHADQQLAAFLHVRAGWDVDSSFLTVIPPSIQDGSLAAGEQTLGQPLHKAYVAIGEEPPRGLAYGAQLNYEGWYNELNRSPYATLDAHIVYRNAGFEYGLYGTNLTNVYADPFTVIGGGMVYGGTPGQPVIDTDAYVFQGTAVNFVLTRTF